MVFGFASYDLYVQFLQEMKKILFIFLLLSQFSFAAENFEEIIKYLHSLKDDSNIELISKEFLVLNSIKREEMKFSLLDDDMLQKAFEVFYFDAYLFSRHMDTIEDILSEKNKRNKITQKDITEMLRLYLRKREIKKAEELKLKYPYFNFPFLPKEIIKSSQHITGSMEVYDTSQWKLGRLYLIDLPEKETKNIFFVFIPGCKLAEEALSEILSVEDFKKNFATSGVALTWTFDPGTVEIWKNYFKIKNIYIAARQEEYPFIDFTVSPGIYFVRNGIKIFEIKGFDKKNFKSDFNIGLNILKAKNEQSIANQYKNKNIVPVPQAGEILSKIPSKERFYFLREMEVKNGFITKYDEKVIEKYYGPDSNKIRSVFFENSYKNKELKGEKLKNILDCVPDTEMKQFLDKMNIMDGKIQSINYTYLKSCDEKKFKDIIKKII